MTTLSIKQAAAIALIPGQAEYVARFGFEFRAPLFYIAREMIYSRDFLYAGVALTTIGAIGFALTKTATTPFSPTKRYFFGAVGILGAGVAIWAANRLFNATSILQSTVNAYARQ